MALTTKLRVHETMTQRGLFSYLYTVVIAGYYADVNDMDLYVDFTNRNNYLDSEGNLFETLFEQSCGERKPSDYESVQRDTDWEEFWPNFVRFDKEVLVHYQQINEVPEARRLFAELIKKFCKVRPDVIKEVDEFCQKNFKGKKVLGVHLRGLQMKYLSMDSSSYHKPTPPLWMFERIIERQLASGNFNSIFICSDDMELITQMHNWCAGKYGNHIAIIEDPYFKTTGGVGLEHIPPNRGDDDTPLAREALLTSLILSRCDFLINQWAGVSVFAAGFNPDLPFHNISNSALFDEWYDSVFEKRKEVERIKQILVKTDAALVDAWNIKHFIPFMNSVPSPPDIEMLSLCPLNDQHLRKSLVSSLLLDLKIDTVVETGTYFGATARWFAEQDVSIYTSELNEAFFNMSKIRLSKFHNAYPFNMDSPIFLRHLDEQGLIPSDARKMFYLDAHWNDSCPLFDELEIVFEKWPNAVVIIDDFQVPHDTGYFFDIYNGRSFNMETITPHIPKDIHVFFPSSPSRKDTGYQRGCVVLTTDSETKSILQQNPLLQIQGT